MLVDADVILFGRPDADPVELAIAELEKSGKSVMYGDEDWGDHNANKRLNGGMMLVKNTQWAIDYHANLTKPWPVNPPIPPRPIPPEPTWTSGAIHPTEHDS
jgi:hypothetical protein